MAIHRVQVVEYVIRKKNYEINDLAKSLQISRRTLYHWFSQSSLSTKNINRIGALIEHDFSLQLSEKI
jgi:DNA-binding NtrC family response regulator